jgi:hypothetical protein
MYIVRINYISIYDYIIHRPEKLTDIYSCVNKFYLYASPSIIRMTKSRRMRWAGHVSRMGDKRNAYRILVGNPKGKRPLGRPRRMWVDNIKMDLRVIGWDYVDCIDMALDRDQWRAHVNTALNLRVP